MTDPHIGPLVVSIAQAGKRLSVSARTVRRLIDAGELVRVRCRGCSRITVDSIDAFVKRGGSQEDGGDDHRPDAGPEGVAR